MLSDVCTGRLLRTLVSAKPCSKLLDLGTGTGMSLLWMVDGMDHDSHIISIDNDAECLAIAQQTFAADDRVQIVLGDGATWLSEYKGYRFDLIFADTWPGKYENVD